MPLLLQSFPAKLGVALEMEYDTYSVRKGGTPLTSHPSLLGASFDPLHIQVETPYAFYAQIRQEEPITFNPSLDAYLVSRYDDIRFIASRHDLFSSKDAIATRPPTAFSPETIAEFKKGYPFKIATIASDGVRHTRLREPRGATKAFVELLWD